MQKKHIKQCSTKYDLHLSICHHHTLFLQIQNSYYEGLQWPVLQLGKEYCAINGAVNHISIDEHRVQLHIAIIQQKISN